MSSSLVLPHPSPPAVWRVTLAGLCASLVGIGLARFAYTPLLPALIAGGWFAPAAAAYLGAASLAGYLAGALLGNPLARRLPAPAVLRGMMVLASLTFVACAWPVGVAWYFAWRFLAGLAGGALMVLAAPTVLPFVPPARRGLASGAIFMGVGLGIAASGTLVPPLLALGLRQAWLGLGALSLLLTAAAWGGWPDGSPHSDGAAAAADPVAVLPTGRLRALYLQYALNALGLVPHMIFLVDFIARGLRRGMAAGSGYWVLFGLGAVAGPVLTGHLADRMGFARALRLAYLLQAAAVALPALGLTAAPWLVVSSVVTGAFTPGIVPLVLGRIQDLLARHPAEQQRAWSRATTAFALLQAGGAYGLSALAVATGDDRPLFAVGAAGLVLALAVDLLAGRDALDGKR